MPFSNNAGIKIFYEIAANLEGIPLVLHTGGAGDLNMWRFAEYTEGLSEFKLILIDHRGRGKSDKPARLEDHRMELYVADVLKVMNDLMIKKSAFWGYSDGCRLGFTLASRFPNRISAMIATGNSGQWETERDTFLLTKTLRSMGTVALIEQLERYENLRVPEPLRSNLLGTPAAEIFALNEEAWLKWCNYDLVPISYGTPTLIINGEKEDPSREGEKLAKSISDSSGLTLEGVGHLGAFLRSDLILPTTLSFLRDHARR